MSFRDALSPLAKQTFDRWRALCIDGKVPRKDDLCPLGLPPSTLPNLMLMERMADDEFRCRLIGTAVRDWYGTNIVGQSMREMVPPAAYEERLPLLRHCIGEGAPAWFVGPLLIDGEPLRRGGRLLLPVSFRGEGAEGVLLIAFVDQLEPAPPSADLSIELEVALVCPRAELGA